jgi:hypothetical protein
MRLRITVPRVAAERGGAQRGGGAERAEGGGAAERGEEKSPHRLPGLRRRRNRMAINVSNALAASRHVRLSLTARP